MTDDERVELYAETIWNASRADEGTISATGAKHVARAVLAVRDAEVERLRADLGRHQEQIETYYAASQEWLRVEAENRDLRARLTAVEALAEEWSKTPQPPDEEYEGTTEGHWAFGEWLATTSNARAIRAALASVPAMDAGDREPANEAVRAAEPRSGQPQGDGTSGGFEAVTEAHSDASEVQP